jgi:hypothetical protein
MYAKHLVNPRKDLIPYAENGMRIDLVFAIAMLRDLAFLL